MLGKVQDREEEFIKYSQNHSLEATAKHFNIGIQYAQTLRRKWCGVTVPRKTKAPGKKEFVAYQKNHTYKECAKHFGVSMYSVYNYKKKYDIHTYRHKDEDYFVNGHNIRIEFPEYAKDHTQRQCAEHFGVDVHTIHNWCSKYKCNTKAKVKTLKSTALKLYILCKEDDIRYFTNIQDIAMFMGYTYPYTVTLLKRDRKINDYKVLIEDITTYR